jgi:adenylate cyclase
MSDTAPSIWPGRADPVAEDANRHVQAALERHKREGMKLAMRARWVALAIIAVMLPFLNPGWDILYYEALMAALGAVGWLQYRVGRVGRSQLEFFVMALDLLLVALIVLVPNPFAPEQWPTAMNYRFHGFIYFFVILAAGTLTYSWRTITAMGHWVAALWLLGALTVWWFGRVDDGLARAATGAFGQDLEMVRILDPNAIGFDIRVQEVVVFVIVAVILAMTVRRFHMLLLETAELNRERENLSRYFSPNVVEELSHNDEPLQQTRTHDVAVMFVDIVGFTSFAAHHSPAEVIGLLRDFHARMESEVFLHGGTLDKYLGDGLMATFGTPTPGSDDATRALTCARHMCAMLDTWNAERLARGELPVKGSIGVHYGPVILGDIGAHRLEFAVIGNTVNVTSRLERLTRSLNASLVVSDTLYHAVRRESGADAPILGGLTRHPPQPVRGLDQPVPVWSDAA